MDIVLLLSMFGGMFIGAAIVAVVTVQELRKEIERDNGSVDGDR